MKERVVKSCTFNLTDGVLALIVPELLEGLIWVLWLDHHDFESYQSHWFKSSARWTFVPVKPRHHKIDRVCVRMHNNMIRELIRWCCRCCCPSILYTCSSPTGAHWCCCHHIVFTSASLPLVLVRTDAAAATFLQQLLCHWCSQMLLLIQLCTRYAATVACAVCYTVVYSPLAHSSILMFEIVSWK